VYVAMQLVVLPQRACLRRGRIELVCDAPVDEGHGLVDTLIKCRNKPSFPSYTTASTRSTTA
jgi:hypothetical protein